ncbi:MAG: hypothetical protein JRJ56_04700, partial [Deltaproteobacteria bacterium]|nr:hypothetical protein [Deltaproteobacteria bacterium]
GRLRFYSRGVRPVVLDTPAVIADDTWYFVAAVADIDHRRRHIYVFAADGTLINHSSDTFRGRWGRDDGLATIGGESNRGETRNRFAGDLDEVQVFGEAVDQAGLAVIRRQRHSCACVQLLAEYRLDECLWSGRAGEVRDSSGSGHHGTAKGSAATESSLAAGGGLCRVGHLAGNRDYLEIPAAPDLNPAAGFTVTAWFRADSLGTWNGIVTKLTDVNHGSGRGWNLQAGRSQRIASLMADAAGHYTYLRSRTIPQTGRWYHVALVHGADDTNQLYVDGVLEASNRHGIAFTSNPLQIGRFYTDSGSLGFDGRVDEVKIFAGSLPADRIREIYANERDGRSWDGGERTCPTCNAVDHFLVVDEGGDGRALACRPELITIQAVDDDGRLLTDYAGIVRLTADRGAAWYADLDGYANDDPPRGEWRGDGRSTADYRFTAADRGQVRLWLRHPDLAAGADRETVRVAVTAGAAAGELAVDFFRAGFQLAWERPAEKLQLAGKPSDQGWQAQEITLEAVRLDPRRRACEEVLDGPQSLQMRLVYLEPATGSRPLLVNGTSVGTDWTAVRLDFNRGAAPLVLRYDDAGRLRLEVRFDSDGDGHDDMFGVDDFILLYRPFGFQVYTTTPDWQADHGPASTVFVRAGRPFNLSARALLWQAADDGDRDGVPDAGASLGDNGLAANYQGRDLQLGHRLEAPAGGAPGSLGVAGISFTDGRAVLDDETFDEVGIITVTVTDDNYLGSGARVEGASRPLGRFVPDHFRVSVPAVSLAPFCHDFTYLGQLFGFDQRPVITITAVNAAGTETRNYRDAFCKLPAAVAAAYRNQADGHELEPTAAAVPLARRSSQTVTIDDHFLYRREVTPPFAADFDLTLPVRDLDGVRYDGDPDGIFTIGHITGLELRSGRLQIADNYGLESEDITHSPFYLQYWDGSRWVLNLDDDCSSGFAFSSPRVTLESGLGVSGGVGYLRVSRPPAGQPEELTVEAAAPAWLAVPGDPDCAGTFVFGIYRGNDRIIYRQGFRD